MTAPCEQVAPAPPFRQTRLYQQIRELRGEKLERVLRPFLILCVEAALPYGKTEHCKKVLALLRDPSTTQQQFRAAAAAAAARDCFISQLFFLVNFG